eukprot:gb/GFBE01007457.1/.p1 GENE.gb/GFBE01007457.1/~~gb/GFBE01007457.1/.p1  ORF type:complete len:242 (+),score=60.17 gb/GFBE01007457.1/:1-726(+)
MASSGHVLALASGGALDLDCLPREATLEMLQACRDRIFALEHEVRSAAEPPRTPAKARAASRVPASSSKAMTKAQIGKEQKSIVKEIKKKITPLKFHTGWDKVSREVKFAADRLPPEAAEQILGISQDSWPASTVTANLGGNDIQRALGLGDGELQGSVWQKGGAIGRHFGAVKAMRLGHAPLELESLKLSYTIKSQRLTGSLVCVNGAGMVASKKRRRGGAGALFGGFESDGFGSEDDFL